MICQYCGEETPCGHEREIRRLKETLEEVISELESESNWANEYFKEGQDLHKEIARLKEAVKEARGIFNQGIKITVWPSTDKGPHQVKEAAKQWLAKYDKNRPQYDREEDSFE